MFWIGGYPLYLFICFIVTLSVAIFAYQYRQFSGTKFFIGIALLGSLMSLASIFELTSEEFQTKLWWRNIQQIPLFITPILIYALVMDYIGKEKYLAKKYLSIISLPLIIYILLIFTDQYHHLMRMDISLESIAGLERIAVQSTYLSMLFILYNNALILIMIFFLLFHYKNTVNNNPSQYFNLIVGLSIPIFIGVFGKYIPIEMFQFIAISYLPSTLIIYWGLFRHQLLAIWPIAKDTIIENMKDGIVLVDNHDTVIELNPPAQQFLSSLCCTHHDTWLGKNINDLLFSHSELHSFYIEKKEAEIELTLESTTYYSVLLLPIKNRKNDKVAILLIVSDITTKKLYEQELLIRATTDSLTGALNRQHFIELTNEKIVSLRRGNGISLLLLDIDDFKQINDTYGHHSGDIVLREFSKFIKQALEDQGIVGRIGGGEFAILLWNMNETNTQKVAEEIRKKIENKVFFLDHNISLNVTVSIGVSYTENIQTTYETLYISADHSLYESKNNGKNQVTYS